VRALAYLMLLEDQYPPFGDAAYPASVTVVDPVGPRDRVTVGLRLILVIPHAIVLFFVLCAWWVTTVVAWFAILITGSYPQGSTTSAAASCDGSSASRSMLLLVDGTPSH
jgi:hypothetical protein